MYKGDRLTKLFWYAMFIVVAGLMWALLWNYALQQVDRQVCSTAVDEEFHRLHCEDVL